MTIKIEKEIIQFVENLSDLIGRIVSIIDYIHEGCPDKETNINLEELLIFIRKEIERIYGVAASRLDKE